jgi:hypothetical protein
VPALDDFWDVVNPEHETGEYASPSRRPFYWPNVEVLGSYRRLAWGGIAFVFLVSVSMFILLGISRQESGGREIAKSFDTEDPVLPLGSDQTIEPGGPLPAPTASINSKGPSSEQKRDTHANPNRKEVTPTRPGNNGRNMPIALTRGPDSKCGAEAALEMELGTIGNGLLLKWKKFPNAAKYHLYISDDDEILIDEFETEKDTSYVLDKSLDPNKFYRWKIVITLENGQTVSADSRRFTSRDFQSVQDPSIKKRKTETRCSESH